MKNEDSVRNVLDELGWKVYDADVSAVVGNAEQIKVDYIVGIGKNKYAADVKYSRNIDNIISTVFYRIVTQVRAYSKVKSKKMLAIFMVDSMSRSSVEKLKRQFIKYAPDFSWLAISNSGGYAYKLNCQTDVEYRNWKDIPEYIREQNNGTGLGFSDLELWLFKVLYYHNYKDSAGAYKVIKNAFQLSKVADVSPRTANKYVNNMLDEGFLRQRNKYDHLHLVNLERYLDRWSGQYRIWDNQYGYYDYIQASSKEKNILLSEKTGLYFYTGSSAAEIYNVKFSTSKKIYIYSLKDNVESIKKDLGLVSAEIETDIIVLRPRHLEAIKRALNYSASEKVVDYIQLYLDCHSLPDRGIEQANEIKERLILQ